MGFANMAEFIGDDIATDYSRADEQGRRQRQPPGEVPAQRAGDREAKSPDRRVPRVLRRARLRSTSRWRPTTSSPPSTPCAARAWSSCDPGLLLRGPELRGRSATCACPIEELQQRGILVDRDEDGYLLQIFTKPSATGRRCSSS
jgi:4-hydroxyphenylpyruvate dioxygenase